MPDIRYPYLPEGRTFRYVPDTDSFMLEAKAARETLAGDSLFPVGMVLVKDGQVIARAGNGYNRGSGTPHVCPRVVLECPSGTGYDLCNLHDTPGHAEPMVVAAAQEAGVDTRGADAYMYGHWWCCEPCWKALIDAGVRDVYVLDDAHERFTREKVFAETLQPSLKTVGIIGFDESWRDALVAACAELGCEVVAPETAEAIVSISRDASGPSGVVYHIQCDEPHAACRMIGNVLKQL